MRGHLTNPTLKTPADLVSHWKSVLTNAKKSGDTALQARAEAELASCKALAAKLRDSAAVIDRRGLRKTATA